MGISRILIAAMISLVGVRHLQGQGLNTVAGTTLRVSLISQLEAIERNTDWKVYARDEEIAPLTTDRIWDGQTSPVEYLQRVCKDDSLQVFADAFQRIFLLKNQSLITELPADAFVKSLSARDNVKYAEATTEKQAKKSSIGENKLVIIGNPLQPGVTPEASIQGYVVDVESGEPIIGAVLFLESNPKKVTSTDAFGYYSWTLPRGSHEVTIKSVGMKTQKRKVQVHGNGKWKVEMRQDIVSLREIVVSKEKDANVSRMQMGMEKLSMKTMKQVPSVFGETDVLRVVMALPGVQTVGESSTGLNVRGGATDQNLVLFNDAVIYNPSHMFGFFSAFNQDVVKEVELYKSSIPAEYGGRLSSVLHITGKDGNKKKFAGNFGIGLITSRLTFEGPIKKDKTSFLLGARGTYSDFFIKQINNPTIRNSSAQFLDANVQLTHIINEKNTLRVSGYASQDAFRINSDTLYRYDNASGVVKYNHVVNSRLSTTFTSSYSRYGFGMFYDKNKVTAFGLMYELNNFSQKGEVHHTITDKHHLVYGAQIQYFQINPGYLKPTRAESEVVPMEVQREQGSESALYIADKYDVHPRLSIYMGLRYSFFQNLGPSTVNTYVKNAPITEDNRLGTNTFQNFVPVKSYHGPEPRLTAKYSLDESSSLKAGFTRTRQYIHMLSNTIAVAPTDVWKLSDTYIKPQVAEQYSLGYYKNFKSNTIETSLEAYYKNFLNTISYRDGAVLVLNPNLEQDLVNATGRGYGVEFLVKKTSGQLNGWLSYTYSRVFQTVNDPANQVVVNRGKEFPTLYDKPHSLNLIGNYRFNHRVSFSLNVVYSTGRPITLPQTTYTLDGAKRVYYSDRNQYRIPNYLRTDESLNIEGNHKHKQKFHNSWTFALYNLWGRNNVYNIYFKSENGQLNGYQVSIFAEALPTITYNVRF